MRQRSQSAAAPVLAATGVVMAGVVTVTAATEQIRGPCDQPICPPEQPMSPDVPEGSNGVTFLSGSQIAAASGAGSGAGFVGITPPSGEIILKGYPPGVNVGPSPLGGIPV